MNATVRPYLGPIILIVASVVMYTLLALGAHAGPLPIEMRTKPAVVADAGPPPPDAAPSKGYGTSPSLAAVVPSADDAEGIVTNLYEAGKTKDYRAVATGLLMLAVFVLRKWGGKWFEPLGKDRGGAVAVLLVGVLGAFATALAAGKPLGIGLAYDGLMMGLSAAGGWIVLKRIVSPKDGDGYGTSPSGGGRP